MHKRFNYIHMQGAISEDGRSQPHPDALAHAAEVAGLRQRIRELEDREDEFRRGETSLARLATFPEQNPNPVIETDLEGAVTYLNPAARDCFPDPDARGRAHPILTGLDAVIDKLHAGEEVASSLVELDMDGRIYEQRTTCMPRSDLVRIFAHDITDLKRLQSRLENSLRDLEETNRELWDTRVQLVQSEKMAAMASLVAGIAHEINTPIGAISSVHDTLSRSAHKLKVLLADRQETDPRTASILQIISNSSDVIRTGAERVVAIVQSLKSFARLDEAELKSVNINEGLTDP